MNIFRIKLKQIIIITLLQFYNYWLSYYILRGDFQKIQLYLYLLCCSYIELSMFVLPPTNKYRGGRQITDPIEGITGILSGVATVWLIRSRRGAKFGFLSFVSNSIRLFLRRFDEALLKIEAKRKISRQYLSSI